MTAKETSGAVVDSRPGNLDEVDTENTDDTLDNNPSRNLRVVPKSPSYFSPTPAFTDYYIHALGVFRRYQTLPRGDPSKRTKLIWKNHPQFRRMIGENVPPLKYRKIKSLIQRLDQVDRSVLPEEGKDLIRSFLREASPIQPLRRPECVDEYGRSVGVGRRKTASAQVWLVLGDGQVLVNDKPLHIAFPRVHDRESALWALKSTSRLDKYNVWALVTGGGPTGQAEAITLGLAKALLVQEPNLKPVLRKAGTVSRNPKRVERKKPGHLKARKKPAWVAR
ncbi:MAG: 37S ribosomal protein S9, mitochondrial [Vezdaea aestivalis]|nr:MAG: 37S ribosomal protein S9, mitochondrial [Vezdaea aestivalis]